MFRTDLGTHQLLPVSTKHYWNAILQSIGASLNANLKVAALALSAAITHPHNQDALLMGEGELFKLDFPLFPVKFGNGKCWLECQL